MIALVIHFVSPKFRSSSENEINSGTWTQDSFELLANSWIKMVKYYSFWKFKEIDISVDWISQGWTKNLIIPTIHRWVRL